ncbi:MAG TPA: FAD-dependent monooxygenase [Trebonia sp.]|nr:FAD-dependent monooxygenase [Trebonia sp.]
MDSGGRPRAVVIGAGIGGLAAAAGLHEAGWDVTAFERAASLEPVGAGLGLGPNGLKALDALGVGDAMRAYAVGQPASPGETAPADPPEPGIRRPDGRWLVRSTNGRMLADRFGDPIIMLLRAHLVDALAARLPDGVVSLSTEVKSVSADGHVVTAAGDDVAADLIVAADGIRSPSRSALFPEHPGLKYSGFTTWRFVTPPLDGPAPEMSETWGRGTVFGVMPLRGGRVYCYAAAPAAPGGGDGDQLAELKTMFGGWHADIPSLLATVSPVDVLRLDVSVLARPLPSFHVGRVAFLGDAAHPMTPNLGQGACQALEDAVVLSRLLAGAAGAAGAVPAALRQYSAVRMPRTRMIVKRSRQAGMMTTWTSPTAVALRDTLVATIGKIAPGAAMVGVNSVFGWEPPALPR